MDSILAQIKGHLDIILKEEDFQDCFLINMEKNDNKVAIFLDADTGVTFEKCRKISRLLEAQIDESLILGEKYTLEVSSPGATAPLKLLRQYPQHVNRKIKVHLLAEEGENEGKEIEGKLIAIENEILHVQSVQGKGKKKVETNHFRNLKPVKI